MNACFSLERPSAAPVVPPTLKRTSWDRTERGSVSLNVDVSVHIHMARGRCKKPRGRERGYQGFVSSPHDGDRQLDLSLGVRTAMRGDACVYVLCVWLTV